MFPKAEIIETNGVNLEVFHKEGAPMRFVTVGLSMLTPGDTKSIRWSKRLSRDVPNQRGMGIHRSLNKSKNMTSRV